MNTRLAWLPRVWATALALLMLWPVLGGGYVLTYDMVWVPELVLRPDVLGLGSGLPRAVPSDRASLLGLVDVRRVRSPAGAFDGGGSLPCWPLARSRPDWGSSSS